MTLPVPQRPCADCGAIVVAKHARYCAPCRPKHRGKPLLYAAWTPVRDAYLRRYYDPCVKGRAAEIAAHLGMPRWRVQRHAAELGLAMPATNRRAWTEADEQFLWAHTGSRPVSWMARQLGRSVASVALKLKRLRMSRRWREGYTLRDLCDCFGVDHRVIEQWAADGLLETRRRGVSAGPRDAWYVTDADLLRFIQAHPLAFELRRVDQPWFMDLLTAGGVFGKALATALSDVAGERGAA